MLGRYIKVFFIVAAAIGLGFASKHFDVQPLEKSAEQMTGQNTQDSKSKEVQKDEVELLLEERKKLLLEQGGDENIFGEDDKVAILLIGIDSRAGQKQGHCDAIQMFSIDRKAQTVSITAVPRGTYSPLPPGPERPTSSYYVSNACGIGGLEYGITQIQKILGQKADYVVVVGFSETLGILRKFKLPTMETLQWLRHRKGYAIGEPQRAHNHSTFLKHLLVKYTPPDQSKIDKLFNYLLYKIVQTDLSFAQTQGLVQEFSNMKLYEHPERITLSMKPRYPVQEIAYDPEHLDEYLDTVLGPIKHVLSPEDYKEITEQKAEDRIVSIIDKKKTDPTFVEWSFKNDIWLQIDNDEKRENARYDLMIRYINQLKDAEQKKQILEDYILEMEQTGMHERASQARLVLRDLVDDSNSSDATSTVQ